MYKRVCKPIVTFKYDEYGIKILDISVLPTNDISVNLYHAESEKDSMMFDDRTSSIGFILHICYDNGYRPKILFKNKNLTWYIIQWVNIDEYNVTNYGLRKEEN